MMQDKNYVIELGQTVHELFATNPDPSAAEIAEAHFPGKVLGGEITEGVRKRLGKIRDFLEENYPEFPVCLVSETYYVRFRDDQPTTTADARKCLAVGHGKSQQGIRLQSGEDDLIWQEAVAVNMAQGAGKMRKGADRTISAVEHHHLTEADGGRMLSDAAGRATPQQPGIAAQLLEALPAADEDDEE